MTLLEMKKKVLEMIEEVSDDFDKITDDPDIDKKLNTIINQIQYELSRLKKIPSYTEIEVKNGDMVRFNDIDSTNEVFQISLASGIKYDLKANGTIIKCLEDGTLGIDYFKYPIRIDENTSDEYEFELSSDVLEIMPYGVAGDVLKSDVSNNYGNIYSNRYELMKQQLDSRYNTGFIEFIGGVDI